MATRDELPPDYADILTALDKDTAKVNRLRSALAEAEAAAEQTVAKGLIRAVELGRNRTEVQKRSPFSPPKVRDIGVDAGLPPDSRYVRAKPAN
jgi:hypothetical protein